MTRSNDTDANRPAPRREAPAAPGRADPDRRDSGMVGDDGGGQRSEVGVPYSGEGNVQRPPDQRTPPDRERPPVAPPPGTGRG